MPAVLVCLALICFLFSSPDCLPAAHAFESSYLPLSERALSRRVRQRLVLDGLEPGMVLPVGKARIEILPGDRSKLPYSTILKVLGTDNAGKPWSYVSAAWMGFASVWSADLDRNGRDDLIILMRREGSGIAPPVYLLILMFEANGRPVPFVVDGYFEVDSHGVKDLVDLENDGHCELIRQSLDDGYWLTSFYQAVACHFHRLNSIAGMALPLYTRFTWSANHLSVKPQTSRHPFEADLSNDVSICRAGAGKKYLEAIDWMPGEKELEPCLLFSDGKRCRPLCRYATMTVVLDESAGRRMVSLSAPGQFERLAGEIKHRRLPVLISGTRIKSNRLLTSEFIFAFNQPGAAQAADRALLLKSKSLDLALSGSFCTQELP